MSKNKSGIRLMFSISFFVLLLSSIASFYSITKLKESETWVQHTYQVIQKLDSVVSNMKDAETGYRGYLLTGNRVFLEPYTGSKEKVMNALGAAEILTRDNENQQRSFPKLKALIDEKYNLAATWITAKETGQELSEVNMLHGKTVMDSIRLVADTMKQREVVLMQQRENTSSTFIFYTPLVVMVGAVIAILLTFFFYLKLKRDMEANERLQNELQMVQQERNQQIDIIDKMAKEVAAGDYSARIALDQMHGQTVANKPKPDNETPTA